jgi:hypothetical protein
MMETRTCRNCSEVIGPHRGRQARYCEDICGNRYRNKTFASKHPDKIISARAAANSNAPSRICYRLKYRAKKLGLDYDLTPEDIVIPDRCPVLGIKLVSYQGKRTSKGYCPDSVSIDRIDHRKGYVKENIRVISARANLLKNNAEVWELEAVLEDLRKLV